MGRDLEPRADGRPCKHCGRALAAAGNVHAEGNYRGKHRCDPDDSGLPYGYDGDPLGDDCSPGCLGAPR
jgi:hypothetical protein